jgi:hypothetical protein
MATCDVYPGWGGALGKISRAHCHEPLLKGLLEFSAPSVTLFCKSETILKPKIYFLKRTCLV